MKKIAQKTATFCIHKNQLFVPNTVRKWIKKGSLYWKRELKKEGVSLYGFKRSQVKSRRGLFPEFEKIILVEFNKRRIAHLDRSAWKLQRFGANEWPQFYQNNRVECDERLEKANRSGFNCSLSYIRKIMEKNSVKSYEKFLYSNQRVPEICFFFFFG